MPARGINLLPRQLLLKMHNSLWDTERFAIGLLTRGALVLHHVMK